MDHRKRKSAPGRWSEIPLIFPGFVQASFDPFVEVPNPIFLRDEDAVLMGPAFLPFLVQFAGFPVLFDD